VVAVSLGESLSLLPASVNIQGRAFGGFYLERKGM